MTEIAYNGSLNNGENISDQEYFLGEESDLLNNRHYKINKNSHRINSLHSKKSLLSPDEFDAFLEKYRISHK